MGTRDGIMVEVLICHLAGRFKIATVTFRIIKAATKTSLRLIPLNTLSYQISSSPVSLVAAGVNGGGNSNISKCATT